MYYLNDLLSPSFQQLHLQLHRGLLNQQNILSWYTVCAESAKYTELVYGVLNQQNIRMTYTMFYAVGNKRRNTGVRKFLRMDLIGCREDDVVSSSLM